MEQNVHDIVVLLLLLVGGEAGVEAVDNVLHGIHTEEDGVHAVVRETRVAALALHGELEGEGRDGACEMSLEWL